MPKRTSNYTADDGFVKDGSPEPIAKRNKKSSDITNARKVKEGKEPVDTAGQKDDEGNDYWELSSGGTRRVTISEFKGKVMVHLREYYEKDGKKLPGKKGISLPMDQFTALVGVLPQIEKVLEGRGETVTPPDYNRSAKRNVTKNEDDAENDAEKKNHEAASEEER